MDEGGVESEYVVIERCRGSRFWIDGFAVYSCGVQVLGVETSAGVIVIVVRVIAISLKTLLVSSVGLLGVLIVLEVAVVVVVVVGVVVVTVVAVAAADMVAVLLLIF